MYERVLQIDRRQWLEQLARATVGLSSASLLSSIGCDSSSSEPSAQSLDPSQWVLGTIIGDSMAPHLLGLHWLARCPNCHQVQPLTLQFEKGTTLVCRKCGKLVTPELTPAAADQLRLRRFGSNADESVSQLERFQLIAVDYDAAPSDEAPSDSQRPEQPSKAWTIKRLWALPGEEIEFRDGVCFIDGERLRKSWAQQLMTRVFVHGDSEYYFRQDAIEALEAKEFREYLEYQSNSTPSTIEVIDAVLSPQLRDQNDDSSSPWQRKDLGWRHDSADRSSILEYRHMRCVLGAATTEGAIEAAIEDALHFDPITPRRLHGVSGIMLDLKATIDRKAKLEVAIHDGFAWIKWIWDRELGTISMWDGEQPIDSAPCAFADSEMPLALSTFDAQAGYQSPADSKLVPLIRDDSLLPQFVFRPIRLRAEGKVQVSELQIWRDLLPTAPKSAGFDWRLGRSLEADEFFLMGDNFAVSIDSRTSSRGVRREQIVGVVPLEQTKTIGR